MNIIKRDGSEAIFNAEKIKIAIGKANSEMFGNDIVPNDIIEVISKTIEKRCESFSRAVSAEEVQDMVEKELYDHKFYAIMKAYMLYRYKREQVRKKNTTDDKVLALLNDSSEEIKQENSNKNPTIISVQRDYMAGEVSKDICERYIYPNTLNEAHRDGIIHLHDRDYVAAREHNCDLIDLADMLQNGTCISGTHIDKPNSFSTACNIATQIIAQVASSQYGGCTFSLAHLVPFIDISRKKISKTVKEELLDIGVPLDGLDEKVKEITEKRLRKEVINGIQTIQYQLITLQTTNGKLKRSGRPA